MLDSFNKKQSKALDQDRKFQLQKKLSKDSVTSTKFCDSTEELPEGSSNSTGSNSNRLFKELKHTEHLERDKQKEFVCNKRRTLLDPDYNPIDKDFTDLLDNEIKAENTTSDFFSINSEKKKNKYNSSCIPTSLTKETDVDNNNNNNNNNSSLFPENKESTTSSTIPTSVPSSVPSSVPISFSTLVPTSIPTSIHTSDNIPVECANTSFLQRGNNLNSFLNISNNTQLNNSIQFNSAYNNPTYRDTVIEDNSNIIYSYPNNSQFLLNANYNTPYTINSETSYIGNCLNTSLNENTYGTSNPIDLNSYTNNINNIYSGNNNSNSNITKLENTISNYQEEYTNISASSFPSLNKFDDSLKSTQFSNNIFDLNNKMSNSKAIDFLNMYSNSVSNTPMGSNNLETLNSAYQSNVNMYTPNTFYGSNNIVNSTTNYNNSNDINNGNIVQDNNNNNNNNNTNNDIYISSIKQNTNTIRNIPVPVSGSGSGSTSVSTVDSQMRMINLSGNTTEGKQMLDVPKVITDKKQQFSVGIETTENVSSQADYSRATHSSHVVDKRFVHEGFDTIKIPKYREVEIVEKIVEIPVVHKVNKYVNKYEIKEIEKIVKKPINKYIETKIEVPELYYQDKIVEIPEMHEVVKIVEKPEIKERIIYKNKIERKIIPKYIEVPIVKIVDKYEEYDDIQEVIKTVHVKKVVEVPTEVIKKVKVPIKKIMEQPNYVPIVKYRDIPIEKIRYVPKIQTVELVKKIPKIIDVHVPVKVPKVKIIDRPYYINKYIDRPVNVPVSKRITPVYKYEGKRIIEIPIHKPYIVTHDKVVPKNVINRMHSGNRSVYTKQLDINSLSPMKKQELFQMVNRNNGTLQRSVSVDNVIGKDAFCLNNNTNFRFNDNRNQTNCLNSNNVNMSSSFSNMNKIPSQQSVMSNRYVGANHHMRKISDMNISKPKPLKFTRSLNTPNSFSNLNINTVGNNPSFNVSNGVRMHPFNSNGITKPICHTNNEMINTSNFTSSSPMNNINNNINNNNVMNSNPQEATSFSNISQNKYFMNNSNPIHFSNNSIYGNNFIPSRSPSICSEGICAYAVEHVGQDQNFGDSNQTAGSRFDKMDRMGSNYSFS